MRTLSTRFSLMVSLLILAIGLAFAALATAWLWHAERRKAVSTVDQAVSATVPAITNRLWNFDYESASAILKGLKQVPEIKGAWLERPEEDWIAAEGLIAPLGQDFDPDSSRPIVHEPADSDRQFELGHLHVTVNLAPAQGRAITIASALLLTLLVVLTGIVFAVRQSFHRLVGRPLGEIAAYMARDDLLSEAPPLALSGPSGNSADELGRLERTINDILADRRADLRELQQYRERLEERVEERSAQLQAAQEELLRAENLAALGSLVAGVAHELNTPIGNGLVAASTLSSQCPDVEAKLEKGTLTRSELEQFIERTRESAQLIENTLGRARELVRDFKQVAVDRQSQHRRRFDPDEVIEETLATLAPSLKRTPFRIEHDLHCRDTGTEMEGYPGPFGQVVTNLVENAVKHGFDQREHGVVRVSSEADDGWIRIRVADDGHGMAESDRRRIFEPFFTTKLAQGGSGLGLSIVHRLVTQVMGGTIEVESAVDRGTTFTIALPKTAPGDQAAPPSSDPDSAASGNSPSDPGDAHDA